MSGATLIDRIMKRDDVYLSDARSIENMIKLEELVHIEGDLVHAILQIADTGTATFRNSEIERSESGKWIATRPTGHTHENEVLLFVLQEAAFAEAHSPRLIGNPKWTAPAPTARAS